MNDVLEIALAGCLHDVGKLFQRAGTGLTDPARRMEPMLCPTNEAGYGTHRHVLWTNDFIERYLAGLPPSVDKARRNGEIDNQTALRLTKRLAVEFREQLIVGIPTNEDEAGLRRLAAQIRAKKVVVKLFLRHPLHAKLYLCCRADPINPKVGYLGSSNLTLAGLSQQGELNVDVLDADACQKLAKWFEDRWNDRFCIDISDELADIVQSSWAGERPIPPYHIPKRSAPGCLTLRPKCQAVAPVPRAPAGSPTARKNARCCSGRVRG